MEPIGLSPKDLVAKAAGGLSPAQRNALARRRLEYLAGVLAGGALLLALVALLAFKSRQPAHRPGPRPGRRAAAVVGLEGVMNLGYYSRVRPTG